MANELNTGSDKLLEPIIKDATADAQATKAQSDKDIQAVAARGEREIAKLKQETAARREAAVRDILESYRTNAELDARKYSLQSRRELMDEAFAKAFEALIALEDGKRTALVKARLISEAEGGEGVLPAAADRARIQAMLPDVNATLASDGRAALTLADGAIEGAGGFMLKSREYDKDCSFEAIMRELKSQYESRVAAILFQ